MLDNTSCPRKIVCATVRVTQGWIVESLFVKGFFFFLPEFPSRDVFQSLRCTFAKYSILVYFDMVEEILEEAPMRNHNQWASNTSLIFSSFIYFFMDDSKLQKCMFVLFGRKTKGTGCLCRFDIYFFFIFCVLLPV